MCHQEEIIYKIRTINESNCRTIIKMTDKYYNNRYSQKYLPLFNIKPHNIVPSTLNIFRSVDIDVFKSLLTIFLKKLIKVIVKFC